MFDFLEASVMYFVSRAVKIMYASVALRTLSVRTVQQIREMVANNTVSGFSLVANRIKTGDILTCELDMRILTYPSIFADF